VKEVTKISVEVVLCALTIWQGQLSVVVSRPTRVASTTDQWELLHTPLLNDVDADETARTLLWIAKSSSVVIEQLRTYSEPVAVGCDRSVTIAYFALISDLADQLRLSDTVRVFAVDDVLSDRDQFADISVLIDAIERVRSKFEYTTIAASMLPEPFTVPELRRVYEAVWGVPLHPANFRRKVLATDGFVIPKIEENSPSGPDLFTRGLKTQLHPAMLRP
jgi:8-oxo-dGTP diphosphatase